MANLTDVVHMMETMLLTLKPAAIDEAGHRTSRTVAQAFAHAVSERSLLGFPVCRA